MIVFVHLLNDCSGSPRVLCSAIATLTSDENHSHLFIGSDGAGSLNEVCIPTTRYWYRRTPYRVLNLVTYLISQMALLFRLLSTRNIDRDALIYVNTLLPFGAALYGWITRRTVVYHLHEVSVNPAPLRWLLVSIARQTAKGLIYVSDFHRDSLPIPGVPAKTVFNALDPDFLARASLNSYQHRRDGCFRVLLLASLRDYKGVPEFLALANRLAVRTDIHFNLVANDDEIAIQRYFAQKRVPSNVTIYSRTPDTVTYYGQASLVLNLSRPDQCVETFGLTLLEAMAFGIPVVAPPVGGPLELVTEGVEGFLVDSQDGDILADKVLMLADDETLCLKLSDGARQKAARFTLDAFALGLRDAVTLHTYRVSAE